VPAATKAASEEQARLQQEEADALFKKHDKDAKGGLKKGEWGQVIRDANDSYVFLQDSEFGAFVKEQWALAEPDGENLVRLESFRKWYAGFVAYFEGVKAKDAAEAAKASEAKAATAKALFGGDGLWSCDLKLLPDALNAAWAKGKTPLLIDATGGDGTSPLETFYSYSGQQLLELKKMVVEVNMKKEKTLEEALEEARKKLLLCLERGYHLIMLCANSAPPMKSKFTSDTELPYLMLADNKAVASAVGSDPKQGWTGAVLRESDKPFYTVHKDFQARRPKLERARATPVAPIRPPTPSPHPRCGTLGRPTLNREPRSPGQLHGLQPCSSHTVRPAMSCHRWRLARWSRSPSSRRRTTSSSCAMRCRSIRCSTSK